MPATSDPALRRQPWNQHPSLTGRYDLSSNDEAPFLDERTAHADSYWGSDLRSEIMEQGPVAEAAERIGQFVCSATAQAPLTYSPAFSEQYGCKVYLKEERNLPVGSFKMRGAINKALRLGVAEREQGFVAVSAGNHAQGVARAAQIVGTTATIFMPSAAPEVKVSAVREMGAEVVLAGDSFEAAQEACREFRESRPEKIFFHPFDDFDIIHGQGTLGHEIFEELPETTHVFCPVGGGGAFAGLTLAAEEHRSAAKLVAVEPEHSAALSLALRRGRPERLRRVATRAEGAAVAQTGAKPYEIISRSDRNIESCIVTERNLVHSTVELNDKVGPVECTGALGFTALKAYAFSPSDVVVAVVSGRHIDARQLAQLRSIVDSDNRLTTAS